MTKKRIEVKKINFWQKYLNLDCNTYYDTTTNDMLQNGLKYKPRSTESAQKIYKNEKEPNLIRRREDQLFCDVPVKNIYRKKLPAIKKNISSHHVINSAMDKNDVSLPKDQFTSEYFANYRKTCALNDQEILRKYPKCYPKPIPGLKIKDNVFPIECTDNFHQTISTDLIEKTLRPYIKLEPWKNAFNMKSKSRYNQPKRAF